MAGRSIRVIQSIVMGRADATLDRAALPETRWNRRRIRLPFLINGATQDYDVPITANFIEEMHEADHGNALKVPMRPMLAGNDRD
jgi:hypothetical protein